MVKKFEYRGVPLEQLEGMSLDRQLRLFNARQRRTLGRYMSNGITDDRRKLNEDIKAVKAGKKSGPIKTHLRDLIVLPYQVGITIEVYSGKEFVPVEIVPEMIGRYIGEYVITNKRVVHGSPGVGASRSSLYVPLK